MKLFKWASALQNELNSLVLEGKEVTFEKLIDWNGKEELTLIKILVNGKELACYEEFKMKFVFRSPDLLFTQNVSTL